MRRQDPGGPIGRAGIALVIAALAATLTGAPVLGADPGGGERVKVIVMFREPPGAAEAREIRALGGTVRHVYTLIDGIAAEVPAQALPGLRRNPRVQSVEPDGTLSAIEPAGVESTAAEAQYEYDNAWGVGRVGAQAVHEAGIWGQGVKVAVIDTGIDYIHDQPASAEPPVVDPEFLSNYAGGWDFVNNDDDPMDDNGHGTHVSGSLAAERNHYLVVGVAPQVELYGLKILDASGNGDESNLIAALQWSLANGIDVVNMSLGTPTVNLALETAVANAGAAGLLMVAASGNTVTLPEIFGGCPVRYPAAYPQVLSTTFTNPNDSLTGYSCTGPEVDFAAPGDNIFSPVPVGTCVNCSPNGYLPLSGTSMASPHLAGVVALLLSAGIPDTGTPGLFDDVRDRLCTTADVAYGVQTIFGTSTPIPTSDPRYPNYFGCGVVDAAEAVLGITPPPPPDNRPPVANADSATVAEDGATDIAVLANDTDPDLDTLTVTGVANPPHGTATVVGGSVHYVPDADYSGPDAFDYSISDGNGGTDTATVSVTVTPVNDAPVANPDSATTAQDTAVTITVLGNDTDIDGPALSVSSASDPPHGTVAVNPNGTITYTPDAGYSGADAFGYSATDGSAVSNVATVSITITAAPPPPPPASTMHVADLDATTSKTRRDWGAKVTVRVHSNTHANVSGAVINGTWSGGASGSASCTTSKNGTCSVSVSKLATSAGSVTFTVTNVTKSGSSYAPAANHDPDADSNGTSITVLRPA